MFLNHGYAFFAPEPGPTHLVEYNLTFPGDRPNERGRFPDPNQQWPRLLYHRHFMLSESLNDYGSFPPEPPPADAPAEVHARYDGMKRDYATLRASMRRHLMTEHGAMDASMHRIAHRPLMLDEFIARNRSLRDQSSYMDLDSPALFPLRIPMPRPQNDGANR
jgi:hypothetical protein